MSIVKNISYSFLTQIPTILLSVAAGIFSTRVIGATGSGEVAVFQFYIQVFILLFCFSFHTAVTYFISSGKIAGEKMTGLGLLILLASTLFFACLLGGDLLFFKIIPHYITGQSHIVVCVYLLLTFFLNNLISFIQPFLYAIKEFNAINRLFIITGSLNALVLFAVFSFHITGWYVFSLVEFLMITVAIQLVNSALWLYVFLKHYKIPNLFTFTIGTEIKGVLSFILIGHLSTFINFFNLQLDIWFVDHYCGKAELGYYSKSANIAQMLWLISNPIVVILTPYLIEKGEDKTSLFGFYSRLNSTFIFMAAIILFFVSPWFFPAFFGSDFELSVIPFKILLPGVVIMSLNKVFSVYIYSENKIFYNLLATIVGLVFTLSLDMILIPIYGIKGAALASTCSYIAVTLVTFSSLLLVLKINFGNYFILNASDIKKLYHAYKNGESEETNTIQEMPKQTLSFNKDMQKSISINQVAEFYDNYVAKQVTYSKNLRHLYLLKKLKQIGINNQHSLLELGCGVGVVSDEIYKKFTPKKITGVDVSPKSIEHAKKLNAKHAETVEFVLGDVCNLSLKEKYDYILIFDLLEHIQSENHERFFKGLSPFLKDDAKILLNIPYAGYLKYLIETEPQNIQIIEEPVTIKDLAAVLDKAGFEIESMETYNLWVEDEYQYIVIKKQENFKLNWLPEKKWFNI